MGVVGVVAKILENDCTIFVKVCCKESTTIAGFVKVFWWLFYPLIILLINVSYLYKQEDWVLCRVFYKNREVAAKQGMGSNLNDDTISSSSLPPLMDSYITFDQTQTNNNITNDLYEQVPCFSIFTPNQITPTFSHLTHMDPTNMSTERTTPTPFGGIMPDLGSCLNPFSRDKKVLKAVLNQFTEKGSPSFGDASSESFLSDVGLPILWNQYWFWGLNWWDLELDFPHQEVVEIMCN